ncbi:MAG TPA: DUF1015 family protein [Negativicutes bacterium]|nr:DUF1015 family protein [Negativicutes bacterium]
MPNIQPLRGLRPLPELAAKIAAPPYDVLDAAEARRITAANPESFLRVTKAEVDCPAEIDCHATQVYDQARTTLTQFIAKGYLVQDRQPCLYIYRQKMGDHQQVGLVAAVAVDDYEHNIIKRHELTRSEKEQDRVNHITATGAQTGPAFLIFRDNGAVGKLLADGMRRPPAYDFVSPDGVEQTLYVIDDPAEVAAFTNAFARLPAAYIADGHHRTAAAARVREHCRENNPAHDGSEAYNRFLAVLFPHTMVKVMAYNRVVQDLAGLSPAAFLAAVAEKFIVEAWPTAYEPVTPHTFGLYLAGRWHKLTAKPELIAADPVACLDVSILQDALLAPVLGIGDPRIDPRIDFVGGIRGLAELGRLVDGGQYAAAFALYPTTVEEIMTIADSGRIMPPKSTWFEPKLKDAMVINLIAGRERDR